MKKARRSLRHTALESPLREFSGGDNESRWYMLARWTGSAKLSQSRTVRALCLPKRHDAEEEEAVGRRRIL